MRAWSLFLCVSFALTANARAQEPGISTTLARDRAGRVSNLRYSLFFSIPKDKAGLISGHEVATFTLSDVSRPLLLDFEPVSPRRIRRLTLGTERLEPR